MLNLRSSLTFVNHFYSTGHSHLFLYNVYGKRSIKERGGQEEEKCFKNCFFEILIYFLMVLMRKLILVD
jgi:hypothetical protein